MNFFWLVGFYGISTLVGYLIPNPVYIYISNIQDLKTNSLWVTFLTKAHLFAQSNSFKHSDVTQMFAQNWMISITDI